METPDVDELQDIIDDAICDAEGRLSSSYLNAHLAKHGYRIVAVEGHAPDLLAALTKCSQKLRTCLLRSGAIEGDDIADAAIEEFTAAIAKATS